MIVDTSAIVAIFNNEPESDLLSAALKRSPRSCIAAPTYLELVMVLTGSRSMRPIDFIDAFLIRLKIETILFSPDMARVAAEGFRRYGKGRGHPAQLNFGDCISYAASKVEAMPLLFKGADFRLTDVECAI